MSLALLCAGLWLERRRRRPRRRPRQPCRLDAAGGRRPASRSSRPIFAGLDVTGTTDRQALVRSGDAIRAATFTFATERDAREAEKRGAGDDYARALADAFRADAARKDGGVRLVVARPAEPGSDTVEVYLVRRGRTLTVSELVSGRGFPPALRKQALAAVSR